jgi:hypothetical protein
VCQHYSAISLCVSVLGFVFLRVPVCTVSNIYILVCMPSWFYEHVALIFVCVCRSSYFCALCYAQYIPACSYYLQFLFVCKYLLVLLFYKINKSLLPVIRKGKFINIFSLSYGLSVRSYISMICLQCSIIEITKCLASVHETQH